MVDAEFAMDDLTLHMTKQADSEAAVDSVMQKLADRTTDHAAAWAIEEMTLHMTAPAAGEPAVAADAADLVMEKLADRVRGEGTAADVPRSTESALSNSAPPPAPTPPASEPDTDPSPRKRSLTPKEGAVRNGSHTTS